MNPVDELRQRLLAKGQEIQKLANEIGNIGSEVIVTALMPPQDLGVPQWIINTNGEIGVQVGSRCFFLYKGESLEYDGPETKCDDGNKMMYRPVLKREFGECCRPAGMSPGDVMDHLDSDTWKPLPVKGG